MKIKVQQLKQRNPLVARALFRKAGKHVNRKREQKNIHSQF
jgi:hypothetical protein